MSGEKLKKNTRVDTQEKIDIVFVGHVDHGKSTVIGRLLADTHSLPEGKLEQVRQSCERNSKPFEYAYLIDALKDERAQNITIDSARVFFKSDKRHYIIIDAPGHIEFIKNMVTGASRAEAAVLVIDAHEGIQENSRRHGYLLWMLGIKQIVVLVNKMDLVNYQKDVYDSIQTEYDKYLHELGIKPICYIPVSGREGDNIVSRSSKTPWYKGDSVLSALDCFEKAKPITDKPFRMPVQDIYRFTKFGDDRRIVSGSISSGTVNVGDEVTFYPSGKTSAIKSIETYSSPEKTMASSGDATGFTLQEQIYIQRGEIATLSSQPAPHVSTRMRVSLFWLGNLPMQTKKQYILKLGTARVKAKIESIDRLIDTSDYATIKGKNKIEHHEVAVCSLILDHPLAFDLSETLTDTSRFVIVDEFEIWGGGIVLEALSDESSELLQEVVNRDRNWIKTNVSVAQRAERFNQRPVLILVTGQKGVGRKRLAAELERRLFEEGKFVYYLGIGSFLYGVSADLKHQNPGIDWHEHVRRMAEAVHIFLDAGMILILTAVELTQEDYKIFNAIIDPGQIETIWVGDEITTDIAFDMQVAEGQENLERSIVQIKHLLQEHGFIFKP